MTKRRITAHKGGRTAIAPSGRIRPQTLDRIHAEMMERGKSFADLIEEIYGGNDPMAKKLTAQKFNEKYVTKEDIIAAGAKWHDDGAYYQFPDGSWGRFTDIKNGAQESRLHFIASTKILAL